MTLSPPSATDDAAAPDREGLGPRLLVVLALLAAAAPIGSDLYLASFPEVKSGLATDATHVQLTLTAFLIGIGLGPLLWGPLSDRVGRRRPLLAGVSIAVVAGVVAVAAPNVEVLIAARFVQALAGSAGMVLGRATVTDLTRGYVRARAMSMMMTITSLAPIVAPVVGGLLADRVSWRGVLGVILGVMVLQVVAAWTTVPESLPPHLRTTGRGDGALASRFRRPAFLAYVLAQAFAFGSLMTYVASSSFVYQHVLGASSRVYGLGFAVNACGMTAAGILSARLARHRVHPVRLVRIGLPVLLAVSACVLLAALSPAPVLVVVPLFFVPASFGFTAGNMSALAMEHTHDAAGAGSAVLGGVMFLAGGVISPLGGLGGDDTAVPMGVVMLASAVLATLCFLVARRYVARHPHLEAAFDD
ncbi:multidrug effflux MFS transporter [Nocardioides sp. CER19]|uniref:multidrug effflux MFS transporter n=1 Tax=Nocardioides sp. CER19 TaxID=3038538 RepID=UPI00244BE2AE|nr:multidrug effflux MFS transporter [Nocardioides sp. CER19]MDH2412541.1 multidrug effflux MFS transporter [Nocardioides sp. CER19]